MAPTLTAPAGTPTDGTYLVIMLDLDVPRGGSTTLLHWLQTDFTLSPNRVVTPTSSANTSSTPGASYIGPNPPPGNPHRYVLWMFAQPADFAIPESFGNINPPASSADRIGFNLTEFVAVAELDEPLAANYFTVVNSSSATTASSTARPSSVSVSATSRPPAQYTGSASSTLTSSMGANLGFVVLLAAAALALA